MQERVPEYDRIGKGYNEHRRADPGWVTAIRHALGLSPPARIADIGAGSGNYSYALAERGFVVEAVEPSRVMRNQCAAHVNLRWHEGAAEAIPLATASVAGIICTLAAHHFDSLEQAAREMGRICPAGPLAVLTVDPRLGERFWLEQYFPEIHQRWFALFPPIEDVAARLCDANAWRHRIILLPLRDDCVDLTAHAAWNRPELYLSDGLRANTSVFALADPCGVRAGVDRLAADLKSGAWDGKFGYLRRQKEIDLGFRIIRCSESWS